MQDLELDARLHPKGTLSHICQQDNRASAFSDLIGDAARYPPLSESGFAIYKLDYISDADLLKMSTIL